jgi:pyruvyltransferase
LCKNATPAEKGIIMKKVVQTPLFFLMILLSVQIFADSTSISDGLPFYYWQPDVGENYGDVLSLKLVERIIQGKVPSIVKNPFLYQRKMLAIGSILQFAGQNDLIWGSGINGKHSRVVDYHFKLLDVRAVRGPLTRDFLLKKFGINCPEIYGDPALLMPFFFPELKRKKFPIYKYLIIPHLSEEAMFPKDQFFNVAYPSEPWEVVTEKILSSEFVISSSLHGIVVAEAFGIPARMLKITDNEPLFKYLDYYFGTGRKSFEFATSIEEALKMGGEEPFKCDLEKLYNVFPFELWPHTHFRKPNFTKSPSKENQ